MEHTWKPDSWKTKPLAQAVVYPDPVALEEVLSDLSRLPPLVTSWEIERLKAELAQAGRGERFLLQGGDCVERMEDCYAPSIVSRLKILLKMSAMIIFGTNKPVTTVGRFAGQYAKPRSSDTETKDGVTLPTFRGPLFNHPEFEESARMLDPHLMLEVYRQSGMTMNFIRSLVSSGFANLHHTDIWDTDEFERFNLSKECLEIAHAVAKSVRFVEAMLARPMTELDHIAFFSSHEGLNLDYEMAHTSRVPRRAGWYDLTTHMPWIGERTRNLDGAHIEFFRGISNPIGVKIGPSVTVKEVLGLCDVLNPGNEPGRLTLIHRMGEQKIGDVLPALLESVKKAGRAVVWCCDPMHGNTFTTADGFKTRSFDSIVSEVEQAFELHQKSGTFLGGVHLELTSDHVTECIGGSLGLSESDLSTAYTSWVDPRLNYEQSLELSLRIAQKANK
ncbi:MAG: 3-deoxy-7-phosphoheptulonate synthase class II [Holophaga sp.]|nr:3-deoxy-7-phosphoheptulonate synthase class II [Holophaga sp.]